MPTRIRTSLSLLLVVVLAGSFTFVLSRGALAGTLFQSSPPSQPISPQPTPTQLVPPSPTPTPPAAPQPSPVLPASPVVVPTTPPILAPVPTVAPVLVATATAPGFLPAPTLTKPDVAAPIQPPAGPGAEPGPDPTRASAASPRTGEAPSDLAGLIDAGVEVLGYAWLCCGAVLLIAAAGVFVWLSRRAAGH